MASLSQDPSLLDAFINGEDIHASTAAKVYRVKTDEVTREMRSKAKGCKFWDYLWYFSFWFVSKYWCL